MRSCSGTKRINVLVILLCICFLIFYAVRRNGASEARFLYGIRFLGGAFIPHKNMTIQEGKSWCSVNKEKLMELHELVLQHPIIRRVDLGTSLKYVPNQEKFAPEDMSAYKTMAEECKSLGIKNIAVFRRFESPYGRLISVDYILSSSGLCVSGGRHLSVEFVPDKQSLPRLFDTPEYIVTPLDEEDWYIVDYREGRK